MNKFKVLPIIGAAAMALGFSACSSEDAPTPAADCLTFEVTLPADMGTRTFSDGLNATHLNVAIYDASNLTNGPVISTIGTGLHADQVSISNTGERTFSVSVPLAHGVNYEIFFWADAYGFENSPYSYNATQQTMAIDYAAAEMNSNNPDAFYAYVKNVSGSKANTQRVRLNRAGAQLNVGALDYEAYNRLSSRPITNSFYQFKEVPYAFNVVSGATTGTATNVTLTAAATPCSGENPEFFPLGSTTTVTEAVEGAPAYLGMAYVLTGTSQSLLSEVTVTFGNETVENVISSTITDVPIQQNYRTNIYGNLLTTFVTYTVEIDPIFKDSYDVVSSAAALKTALENGEDVVLNGNIENAGRINIPAGKTLTIDLNGNNIDGVCFVAYTGSNVTFKGEGTVTGGSSLATVTAYGSTVNIEGGNFVAGLDSKGGSNSCIYSEQGGTVNISGGSFKVQKSWTNSLGEEVYFVLNRQNGSTGTFNCTGGTFYNYNPENGDDADKGLNWVAEGYTVQQNGDAYIVVAK